MSTKKLSRQERRAQERKLKKEGTSKSSTNTALSKSSKWYIVLLALLIALICFSNVGDFEFVNWDDDKNTYENPTVINFNTDDLGNSVKEIFTSHVIGNYNPLTILTFAYDKVFYGFDDPGPWHWENVFLHLICIFFVYRICLLLGLSWRGGLLVALLFGIHPMRVESVTWVTERKDVLFGAFFLSALYIYIRSKIKPKKLDVLWITLLFILSCLSKIQAVALPLTMLAIDYYMDKNVNWKNLYSKAHYFLISLSTGLVGIYFLKLQGSIQSTESFSFLQRIFIGAYSFVIYCIKLIVPYRMCPLYPYPKTIPWYFYASIVIIPIVIWVLWKAHKTGKKHIVFGLSVFIVNIIFLLQILGAGQGFLADRFSYIPYLGLFFIMGYYLDSILQSDTKFKKVAIGISSAFVIVLGVVTYNQNKIWENSGTMWTHVLKYYKNTDLPYGNRANYYRDNGQYDLALKDYDKAIQLKGVNPKALNSRGRLYFTKGGQQNFQLALQDYSLAIEQMSQTKQSAEKDESLGEFYINRGAAYAMLGQSDLAIAEFNKGLQLKPNHKSGYLNRSVIYNQKGQYQKALDDIEMYFKFDPYNADMWYESARLKRALRREPEAIQDYSKAIQLNGNKGVYYYERSRTLSQQGDKAGAIRDLQKAIDLKYKNIDPAYRASIGI